jgi:hypothetical protein
MQALAHSKAFAVLAVVLALVSVARADTPPDAGDRPWAKDVSEDAQKQALVLFEEGNKRFENSEHAAALAKYREALKIWDHPAIRYNAAVALINLDQPLVANDNLELALRYGEAPFNPETYQQALTYRKLLRGQLAELKVTCSESGTDVALDGTTLFVAPGEAARWLLPGAHQLVGRKTGYLTATRSLSLLPGKPTVESLSLQEIGTLPTKTVQRWPTWKPWAVLGGGVLVALAGVPLMLDVKSNLVAYDDGIKRSCAGGCLPGMIPQAVSDARDRARTENVVAISLFAVGGAALASGVAMLVLNQPRVVPVEDRPHTAVVPLAGRGTIGLSIAFAP